MSSSGSSGRVGGGGAEKHEIYTTAFGGHLFYDLFLHDRGEGGGMALSAPPGSATDVNLCSFKIFFVRNLIALDKLNFVYAVLQSV